MGIELAAGSTRPIEGEPMFGTKRLAFKLEPGDQGTFQATFATFNVIDHDGDVTIPGAFTTGEAVRIAGWGHNWNMPPIGRGVIDQDESRAWVDGAFFLDTAAGLDTYLTVKHLGELQEWSYGFDIKKWSMGEFGEPPDHVRFLEDMRVIEVSPVMLGAGIDTRTDAIKSLLASDDTLADQAALVLAANGALSDRLRSLAELRRKEGRELSQANRERLRLHGDSAASIAEDLRAMYAATAPAPKSAPGSDARRAAMAALRIELDSIPILAGRAAG
jgi:HK97 family phage prohead protease